MTETLSIPMFAPEPAPALAPAPVSKPAPAPKPEVPEATAVEDEPESPAPPATPAPEPPVPTTAATDDPFAALPLSAPRATKAKTRSVPVVVLPPAPAPAPVVEEEESANPFADAVLASTQRAAEDDEEEEERPRGRGAKKPNKPNAGRDSGARVALLACVGAVLLVGLAIGGYFAFRGSPKEPVKHDPMPPAPQPPAKKDKDQKKDQGPLTPEQMVKRVKTSTVYIRVHLPGGGVASGTGFFAGKPGYVVTNAHVVGYGPVRIQVPTKVEVVVDSGDPGERTVVAKIFGLDAELDLAVLQVEMKDMPAMLPFGKAESLTETQEVIAFGYPLGERLGKEMSVNSTKVSSLRKKNGTIDRVQLAGGLNPGNSGGPVANAKGEVVGVSVSMIRNADSICFAIPAEVADRFVDDMHACGGEIRVPTWLKQFNEKIDAVLAPKSWAPLRIPPPRPAALTPAKIDGASAVVNLSSPAADVCVGGAGRFVVFHLPNEKQLAVLDVCAARVVKTIAAPEKVLFTASMDMLFVVDVENNRIERWNLTTLAKDGFLPLPVSSGLTVSAVAIGSASNGPLLVQARSDGRLGERFLFDVVVGREVKGSRTIAVGPDKEHSRLHASADGRTFLRVHPKSEAEVIVVTDTSYYESEVDASFEGAGDFAVLSGDGQTVFTHDSIETRTGSVIGRGPLGAGPCFPAATGPLVLAASQKRLALFAGRDRKPLAELPPIPALEPVFDRKKVPHPDRHVVFVPAAQALVVLAPDGASVTLHKLDVDALLESAGDYLFVTSGPPQASAGKSFDYQLAVKSKRPATGFKLVSGPKDLTVSADGRVRWAVPDSFAKPATVAVTITDTEGKDHRHEFELIPTPPPPE